jgi:hypothetical protein
MNAPATPLNRISANAPLAAKLALVLRALVRTELADRAAAAGQPFDPQASAETLLAALHRHGLTLTTSEELEALRDYYGATTGGQPLSAARGIAAMAKIVNDEPE